MRFTKTANDSSEWTLHPFMHVITYTCLKFDADLANLCY